jgi:hypothetical protein
MRYVFVIGNPSFSYKSKGLPPWQWLPESQRSATPLSLFLWDKLPNLRPCCARSREEGSQRNFIRLFFSLSKSCADELQPEEEIPTGPFINSHYHPNFTMSFIPDTGVMVYPSLHPAVRQYVHLEASGARDATGQNGWYYPVLFVNTFWQLRSHMTALNSTVKRLPLHINLNNQANWKFSLIASMDEGAKSTSRAAAQGQAPPGGGDGSEFEMIKEVLLDTNIYLLGTTVVVSIFHMIFEMLAFKSDISHYRNKKNNVGISVRSILGNVFMQAVIFLYLLDNNENTSMSLLLHFSMIGS